MRHIHRRITTGLAFGMAMAFTLSGGTSLATGSRLETRQDQAAQFWTRPGTWRSTDFHSHTYLTDGSHLQEDVAGHAFDLFNLDVMANAEHGGKYNRTPEGDLWPADTTFLGSPPAGTMWRWQSLRDYSYPLISDLRLDYPSRTLIQGYEWNVPAHEHSVVGIVGPRAERSGLSVAQHEYLFDASDTGTTSNTFLRLGATVKNTTNDHAKAVAGAAWLQAQFPAASYFLLNHPSRRLKYSAADIRDLINAGPSVTLGMEGIPGHQKEPFRGGYDNTGLVDGSGNDLTYKARTYGGADYLLAKTGGLWDSLLGEGRRFWVVTNSDFHSSASDADFWPGEYAKTWIFAKDKTPQALVDGLRSGNVFIATGDLIPGSTVIGTIHRGDRT